MTTLIPSQFIKDQRYGVLSTHSVSLPGYPFGSITPYIITEEGDLAIFISQLAEHTHNIQANPKVSLTIFEPADSETPSAKPRITCLANAQRSEDEKQLRIDYLKQFPDSAIILDLPDFQFYLLKLVKIRLVAGFGNVKWLEATKLSL